VVKGRRGTSLDHFFVLPTFAGIFMYPTFINDGTVSENVKDIWYITLPALFNVGWASVQISHMSIVNQLSNSVNKKDKLVNNRNGFTYAANIVVLSSALIVFIASDNTVTQFRILCAICLISGCCTTGFYMSNIREVKLSNEAKYYDKLYKN
jgi:Na+/melibiose symporter-like transporter